MVDSKRAETMRKRLGERASRLCPNDSWLPKYRSVQLRVSDEEFAKMVDLAYEADNPERYFAKMTAKARLEETLKFIRRLLNRSTEVMSYVADKVKGGSMRLAGYVADKVAENGYSMSDLIAMLELARNKNNPDRYLVGILKKGYVRYTPKNV